VNSVDIYGEPIQLNYRGQPAFKTKVGCLATLATFGLMFGFGYSKVAQLINKTNPSITQTSITLDLLNSDVEPNLKDNKFEISIALVPDPFDNGTGLKSLLPLDYISRDFNVSDLMNMTASVEKKSV
jgi:hypothetical protein